MQHEAGLKLAFLDRRLSSTLVACRLTKDDVAINEPDAVGEPFPGWRVIANHACTDTEILESDVLPMGERFRNVPAHSGGFRGMREFGEGSALEGLGLDAGVFFASSERGNDARTFDLNAWQRVDLAAWYEPDLPVGSPVRA